MWSSAFGFSKNQNKSWKFEKFPCLIFIFFLENNWEYRHPCPCTAQSAGLLKI